MPRAFNRCVAGKGRVRRISHGSTYINVCWPRGRAGGRPVAGHPHHKKTKRHTKKSRKL